MEAKGAQENEKTEIEESSKEQEEKSRRETQQYTEFRWRAGGAPVSSSVREMLEEVLVLECACRAE